MTVLANSSVLEQCVRWRTVSGMGLPAFRLDREPFWSGCDSIHVLVGEAQLLMDYLSPPSAGGQLKPEDIEIGAS